MLYLFVLCLIILGVLALISYTLYGDGAFVWQEIVALFLDPGVFGGQGKHDIFRLIVALFGVFTFTTLLTSLFTNLISNVVESYKNGGIRVIGKNHILIIGYSSRVPKMLKELAGKDFYDDIVILTEQDIPSLRVELEHELRGAGLNDRIGFQKGRCSLGKDVVACHPWNARMIYVIGDTNVDNHDSEVIRCAEILKSSCEGSNRDIPCTVMLEDELSMDVFKYQVTPSENTRIKIDYLPAYEYQAEQLLVYSDFLPAITADSDKCSHVVIFGKSQIAKSLAYITAHISHYPNFSEGKNRTVITIISEDIRGFMESLVLSKRNLFTLCHWQYIGENGVEKHSPSAEMGDFLDIEWQFVDGCFHSFFVNDLLRSWAEDNHQELSFIVAGDDPYENIQISLSLAKMSLSGRLAVYDDSESGLLKAAEETSIYNNITIFGPAAENSDPLCLNRTRRGRNVNFIYDRAYSVAKSDNREEAWYKLPEAHKLSSIYCSDAMPLRVRCYDMAGDRLPIYEGEHRRWMLSVLLLGYESLPVEQASQVRGDATLAKEYKSKFIHPDITPFNELSEAEQSKDAVIIDATDEILNN